MQLHPRAIGPHSSRTTAGALLGAAIALTLTPSALADVTVRKNKTYTNNTGQRASDFHLKVWQKEDNIEIKEFNVDFRPGAGGTTISSESTARGDQPAPAHGSLDNLPGSPPTADADNGQHAVDGDMLGHIPNGAKVEVRVRFELTRWNTVRFHNPRWTFDGSAPAIQAGPNDAFEVTDPLPVGGGLFEHTFILSNDDNGGSSMPMLVRDLRFGTVPDFDSVDDGDALNAFGAYGASEPDFILNPGQQAAFSVLTTGPFIGGGILAAYSIHDVSGAPIAEAVAGHEVDDAQIAYGGDDCGNPHEVFGQGFHTFDTGFAGTGLEGQAECGPIERDVWFRWTADADGLAVITTCEGPPLDTKLAVYPGGGCPLDGSSLDCNDDFCGPASAVMFQAVAGQQYMVQVGSPSALMGGVGELLFFIEPPQIGQPYCTSLPNSTGMPSQIFAFGSPSLAAGDLHLAASAAPAGQPGIFFHGTQAVQVPFGNGFLCAAGAITRLPVVWEGGGQYQYQVDFSSYGFAFSPGASNHFQCWFRDPAAGGAAFNTSNGVQITFLP